MTLHHLNVKILQTNTDRRWRVRFEFDDGHTIWVPNTFATKEEAIAAKDLIMNAAGISGVDYFRIQ